MSSANYCNWASRAGRTNTRLSSCRRPGCRWMPSIWPPPRLQSLSFWLVSCASSSHWTLLLSAMEVFVCFRFESYGLLPLLFILLGLLFCFVFLGLCCCITDWPQMSLSNALQLEESRANFLGSLRRRPGDQEAAAQPPATEDLTQARLLLSMLLRLPRDCARFSEQQVYSKPSLLVKDVISSLPAPGRLNEDQHLFTLRFADVLDKVYDEARVNST